MIGRAIFSDTLDELFRMGRKAKALQARLDEIYANAASYEKSCEAAKRQSNQTTGDRLYPDYHKANEGLCAVRLILATKPRR